VASAALGLALFTSPWAFGETSDPIALWSAVFGGSLVIRLGASAALRYRAWKAWSEVALGFWLQCAPWLLQLTSVVWVARLHEAVGLAITALAVAELRISKAIADRMSCVPRRAGQYRSVLSGRGGQAC
jgi:hypothetical protein